MTALLESAKEKLQSLRTKQREEEQALANAIWQEEQVVQYYAEANQRIKTGRDTVERAKAMLATHVVNVDAVIQSEFNRLLSAGVNESSIDYCLAEIGGACRRAEAQKHHARIVELLKDAVVTSPEREFGKWAEENRTILKKHGLVK